MSETSGESLGDTISEVSGAASIVSANPLVEDKAPVPKVKIGDGCMDMQPAAMKVLQWRQAVDKVVYKKLPDPAPITIEPDQIFPPPIAKTKLNQTCTNPACTIKAPPKNLPSKARRKAARAAALKNSPGPDGYTDEKKRRISNKYEFQIRHHMWCNWNAGDGPARLAEFLGSPEKTWSMEEEMAQTGMISPEGIYVAVNRYTGLPTKWVPYGLSCPFRVIIDMHADFAIRHDHHDVDNHPNESSRPLNSRLEPALNKLMRQNFFVTNYIKGTWRSGFRTILWVDDIYGMATPGGNADMYDSDEDADLDDSPEEDSDTDINDDDESVN